MKKLLLFAGVLFLMNSAATGQCSMTIDYGDQTCYMDCNGWAVITPTGAEPFTFIWSNSSTVQENYYLCSGFYEVTMTDGLGCQTVESFTIGAPLMFYLMTDSTKNATCNGYSDGEAWVHAIGGTPPYTYNWGGGEDTTHMTGLAEGYYYPWVTDSFGCVANASVIINSPTPITISEILNSETSCFNYYASVEVIPVGGSPFTQPNPPYLYNWSTLENPNYATTDAVFALGPGVYTVTVTDSAGCSVEKTYVINAMDGPAPSVTWTDVTCNGLSDGQITDITYTNTPVGFLWSTGLAIEGPPANLPAGDYWLSVTDIGSCNGYAYFTINEPDTLATNASQMNPYCYGDSTGSIYLSVSGGTQSYNYLWSNGSTVDMLYNLVNGTYTLTVTDQNGCLLIEPFVIQSPPQLIFDSMHINNVSCLGMADASITFYMSGGVTPYWFSYDGGISFDTISNIVNLAPNLQYTFIIKDHNYCFYSPDVQVTFTEPSELTHSVTWADPSCSLDDGTITITPGGGTPAYSIEWYPSEYTGFNPTGLGPGFYSYTVTDANGCETMFYVDLFQNSVSPVLRGSSYYSGIDFPLNELNIFLLKPTNPGAGLMDTVSQIINDVPVWEFTGLMPGNYFLKAAPVNEALYPDVLVSYYDNSYLWTDALMLSLSCDDTLTLSFNMYVMAPPTAGNCSLSGVIHYDDGTKSGKAAGEPVPGGEVLIEQEPNNVPLYSATTNTQGEYSFTGVAAGDDYFLLVDIPGMPQLSTYTGISLTDGSSVQNLNFLVDTTSGTGGYFVEDTASSVIDIPSESFSAEIYPNPFINSLNVTLNLGIDNNIVLVLYDNKGRVVKKLNAGILNAGKHEFKLTPDVVSAGQYYLSVQAGKTVYLKKLTGVK